LSISPIWKDNKYFGKHGFKKKGQKPDVKPINIGEIDKLISSGKIKQEGDLFVLDLANKGYNKLLGKGLLIHKVKIKVDSATQKAIDKCKKVGGEVVLKKEETK
jgi:large subunit ribosomal protein L15